ncbi:hypothetical protein ACH42_05690 [Endozoicomonas sp. (ex Bugula neritina AB1)]|nr:hypothetical protein ACH42_05690 [Endozoicomonas sp. (ex Bugula neritina AB1)]
MATEIDMAISEYSADIGISTPLSKTSEVSGSFLYHEDNGHALDFGIYGSGRSGKISGKFGVKGYVGEVGNANGWGIAPGGALAFNFSERLRVEGDYYYSPSVLAFADFDNMEEFSTRLLFSPIPNIDFYVGYRDVTVRPNGVKKPYTMAVISALASTYNQR